ncbi:MAG: histidine kinase [Propionibacteriaceae bacterium]|nr:histidine kinase [Propionibacteriaceae bacterium]
MAQKTSLNPPAFLTAGRGRGITWRASWRWAVWLLLAALVVGAVDDAVAAWARADYLQAANQAVLIITCLMAATMPRHVSTMILVVALSGALSVWAREGMAAWLCFLVAGFTAGYSRRWRTVASLVTLFGAWLLAAAITEAPFATAWLWLWTPPFVVAIAVGWYVGQQAAGRASAAASLAERAARESAQRTHERALLARELHHSVSRRLTIATMQAALSADRTGDPRFAEIEETCRAAHRDLRQLVRALGGTSDPPPAPALEECDVQRVLEVAAAQLRSIGVDTEIHLRAEALPPSTAYLTCVVVEEAVANVIAHAAGGLCAITVHADDQVYVEVVNDLAEGFVQPPSTQVGLRHLEEQIAGVGGRLESGPVAHERWRFSCRLPL